MDTKYWNSLAEGFGEKVLEISKKDIRGVLRKEIAVLSRNASIAADLGCGAGGLLPLLSPKFKKVYAVDYASDLLDIAKQRYNFKNVEYVCHNLASLNGLSFKADVAFSVNALISPSYTEREKIARSVCKATKPKGLSIFVVPSFESIINTYHAVIRCQVKDGEKHTKSADILEHVYKQEVYSSVSGIVNIGGEPTKCFTQEEISVFLSDLGYRIMRVRKVEYPWEEEIDDVPLWLKEPYPWDWFVLAQRV